MRSGAPEASAIMGERAVWRVDSSSATSGLQHADVGVGFSTDVRPLVTHLAGAADHFAPGQAQGG
jgi:hypothetical protein